MNRFRDICSSSDSDEDIQKGPVQRGRIRENQRIQEVKLKAFEQAETAQIIIPKKKKPTKSKPKPIPQQISLEIQTNEYNQNFSVSANQKFIREQIKPVQQHLKNFLQKINEIKTERKKFTSALSVSTKDHQKVSLRISELKIEELKLKHSSQQKTDCENTSKVSANLKNMLELESKIIMHMTKVMKQHEKTIQLLTQCRKDMDRTFQKVKFEFLDLRGIDLYNQENDEYQTFGIFQVYKCIEEADRIIQEITSFSK